MKTVEELKKFFYGTLLNSLAELEQERKQVLQKVYQAEGAVIVVTIIALFFFGGFSGGEGFIWGLVLGGVVMFLVFKYLTKQYCSKFKDVVIAPLVTFFDPNLHYDKNDYVPSVLYMNSKIFPHDVDRYRGDDFVKGRLGQTDIQFSELHTEYKTVTVDSRGRRREQWHTIFKGLFFIADFNKHFKGRTVVLPDKAEKMLGGFGKFLQSKNMSRDPLVKMDDPEFERAFVVYGTDQIEARYILTSSLMKRIVDFQKQANKNIHLSFVHSQVFVAISYTKNLFETNVFKTLMRFAPIEEYYNDLQTALSIVEELNLNTRIWTKE